MISISPNVTRYGSLWGREWPNVSFVFYVILCFFTMNARIFSLNNCVFLYFLTPRCRRAKGNNFLLGLSFGKRVVRPKQHRGNPLCILRVFVFFLKIWGHTTNILHVFLCFCVFLSINFYFGHKSERGQTPNVFCVFLCFFLQVSGNTTNVFCVFLCFFLRSEDTQPTSSMCFFCFCVFLFINFYFGHKSERGKTPNVFFVFLCFFLQVSG